MDRIGIVSLPDPVRAGPVLNQVIDWLLKREVTIHMDMDTTRMFREFSDIPVPSCSMDELPHRSDFIVVLGGDGTLLRTARHVGDASVPMLGVNLGGLGFLTDVKEDEVIATLETVLGGRYSLDERMVLHATYKQKGVQGPQSAFALNEFVVNNGPKSRMINLASYVDGKWINTFLADGLIIATPTGSTAYSLSAGGPIIHPKLHAILITPICPHILTNCPIVISDQEKIRVVVQEKGIGNGGECIFSGDGQAITSLKPGDQVEVKKARHTFRLIQPEGTDYYHVLRTKLKWGERG